MSRVKVVHQDRQNMYDIDLSKVCKVVIVNVRGDSIVIEDLKKKYPDKGIAIDNAWAVTENADGDDIENLPHGVVNLLTDWHSTSPRNSAQIAYDLIVDNLALGGIAILEHD